MFDSIQLENLESKIKVLHVTATGHPTDVIQAFHELCTIVLGRQPWRISYVQGNCYGGESRDSSMTWDLRAHTK